MAYGTPDESTGLNPIVEINLRATQNDGFYFQTNPEEQYIGLYHRHEDGTLMIGGGILGVNHELIPDEIIFRKISYQDIQDTRERVSDLFYKIWFQSNTLTDEEVLSLQTTIRDGIKQTGRNEDEPLVFYKKDRNTLENRKDLQGETFEQMCQYIYGNNIDNLDDLFSLRSIIGAPLDGEEVVEYRIEFSHATVRYEILVAQKVGNEFTDILNLSQLTVPKFGNKIKPEKASEVLDTNIFELLPTQTTRQDQIDNFFIEFDNLIGPKPGFIDADNDGIGEQVQNYEQDEQSRISYENQPSAYITRLDSQSENSSVNQGKTIESMRNKLNTYLGDVDNVITKLEDQRPEYKNISNGFLKIRKPNQAIILRSPTDGELEFQKNNSYLTDGFTITMWVRFIGKTQGGTLFNYGNPLEEDGFGFRLDTKINEYNDNYYRYIRLIVRDENGILRDNHFGQSEVAPPLGRLNERSTSLGHTQGHNAFPQIPTDDFDEWYFICATYNPNIDEQELDGDSPYFTDKQYWLNHVNEDGEIVANSGLGAKCKVETISRSDLLRARGYKVGDISILSLYQEEEEQDEQDEQDERDEIDDKKERFDIEIEYDKPEETEPEPDVNY